MYGRRGGRGGRGRQNNEPPGEDGFFEGSDSILLRVAGVKGNSDVEGYEDCIPVMSFSWNLAQQTSAVQPPRRLRQLKAAEKKRRFLEAGLDEHGNPKEDEDETAAGETKDAASATPAKKKKKSGLTAEEFVLVREAALDGYDSDDYAGIEFNESEVMVPRMGKPHIGSFTITKFNDVASAGLFALILSKQKGVEAQVILTKQRAKKVEGAAEDGSASSADAAPAARAAASGVNRTARANLFGAAPAEEGEEPETPPVPREVAVIQEWTLFNVMLSSVSISGGSGGRPVESLSLDFGSFQYRFVDWESKKPTALAPAEKSIIYDHIRQQVKPYNEAVQAELNKSDQLRPSASVVLGYL